MGAGPSEGHQGTAYHPALRHAQDVSEVSQSPLSDRTQQVEHCSCVPIVLASDDMQASAVEAVDTAHHCSSQRPRIVYFATQQPPYLVRLLHISNVPRQFRSSNLHQLSASRTKLNIVKHAFSFAAPNILE